MENKTKKSISLQFRKFKKDVIFHKATSRAWKIFRAALVISLCYILVYPIIYMIVISFRDIQDMYEGSIKWITRNYTLYNITRVYEALKYPQTLLNTVYVSVFSSVLTIITASFTGYGFARFKFPGRNIMFGVLLFTIIVPQQFIILPIYLNFSEMKLLGSFMAAFLPASFGAGIRAGLCIYIFRQFFKGMPKELEEAAYMDGCGYFKTYLRIMSRLAVPAFVTCFLFSFVWNWNDYQVNALLLVGKNLLSPSLIIMGQLLQNSSAGQAGFDLTRYQMDLQTGALLAIGPIIIVYLIFQRFFVESIERSGLVE